METAQAATPVGLLPACVAFVDTFGDADASLLFPEERAIVASATAGRQAEFTTGRVCAHRALTELGVPPAPLVQGERRAPRWPAGVVGSITHCKGYRAAAVARAADMVALGIDAEPNAPLPEQVMDAISLPAERTGTARLANADESVHWERLLFCAKEATYKAWFPLARRWLGFSQAWVSLHRQGTFDVHLLVPGPFIGGEQVNGFSGRWIERNGFVVAAVAAVVQGSCNTEPYLGEP